MTSCVCSVNVESLTCEESRGLSESLDDWCWGDGPIRVGFRGSVKMRAEITTVQLRFDIAKCRAAAKGQKS